MTVQIKICGLSTPETIDAAINAGATHVGLVHFEPSSRPVSLDDAAPLRAHVPPHVKTVLLLVNTEPEPTARALDAVRPDVVQFHGREPPQWTALVREKTDVEVWKALGVRDAETLERSADYHDKVDRLLFDAPADTQPGGHGVAFDWSLLAGHGHKVDWGLAGGLAPDNVAQAIRATGAPLVDASSGLESAPGMKDVDLIRAFCKAAREA